jgi:predicted metal-dependent phosphoesterase TrpH
MIDLHTHSTASDGACTPGLLVKEAASKGIWAFALTDHDTIDGVAEATAAATEHNIRLIPGVELEIDWGHGEFHLLGLGLFAPSQNFIDMLAEFSRVREERNLIIMDKMNRMFGLKATYEAICALAGDGSKSVGRPHFASYLIRHHKVKTAELAFDKYLGMGKPLFVKKAGIDFERACAAIKESGGIAVLAHPATLRMAISKIQEFFKSFKDRGLDGVEAYHPNATVHNCERYEAAALASGLLVTAGSDYHGDRRKDRKLGNSAGGIAIDDRFLPEVLREKIIN